MFFRTRKDRASGAALEARRPELAEADRLAGANRLSEAIDLLATANRSSRSTEIEVRIRRLRNLAGVALLEAPNPSPSFADPAPAPPPLGGDSRVPEVRPAELSAPALRAAILSSGCILVRGLFDRDGAEALAAGIERAFETRIRLADSGSDPEGYYDELEPEPPFEMGDRDWIEQGGGVLAADSPRLMFDLLDRLDAAGVRDVIAAYLGEPPAISAQKCTLRRADPGVQGAWHQDGKFMGDVRSLNVWIALSRCGDVAPGLDIVPRRLEHFVETGTEGTWFDSQIAPDLAAEAAGEAGVVRPIFEPGDALLFDDLFLHQTGSGPEMTRPRYAIESWFFGPSAYPREYVPIAF